MEADIKLIQIPERVPSASEVRTPVRVVDSDIHPVPRAGELAEYIPEPFRSKHYLSHKKGDTIIYDAPDYAYAKAMRVDTFPADGNFAGSDPDLALRQAVVEGGSDIGILEPGFATHFLPEMSQALCIGMNHWLANNWLDSVHNWHERWRGSICVAIEDAPGAVRQIDEWADHPYMSQVLIRAEPRPAWGSPQYDPVWAAAARHDIPVACHLSRGRDDMMPMPPVGFPSYNHDFMVTYSLLAANQIMSLIFDGVFERFPTLRIILVEHAFSWILPLMWRMDAIYAKRKSSMDIRRKPSEYVKEHIKFTTQPLDYPEDKTELTRALELMEADKILLFSSDYPHWTYDGPRWLLKHLPEHMREPIMFKNGLETYHLSDTVPALDGKAQVF